MNVKIDKVCVATDFGELAARAFERAADLAESHGAELHVLHVFQDLGPVPRSSEHRLCLEMAREYFNQLRDRNTPASPTPAGDGPPCSHVLEDLERSAEESFAQLAASNGAPRNFVRALRFGNPVDEICHYCRQQGIDLLVLGTHGRTGVNRVLMGSVAERLVRTGPSVVLTVRGGHVEAPV
jgi:nucleotide-binding universal stress UspA family protein